MLLQIVVAPNKVLREKTKKVTSFNKKLTELIFNMTETLLATKDPEGVGLAANQVGFPVSLFITRASKKAKVKEFINPEILEFKESADNSLNDESDKFTLEGCLSLPKIWAPIKRASAVKLSYFTKDGKPHMEWFNGFMAVIIQHEIDHLNGVLFTSKALEQKATVYEEIEGDFKKIKLI